MTNGGSEYGGIDTKYEFFPSVREGYRPTRAYLGGSLTGRTTMAVDLAVEGRPVGGGDFEEADDRPSVDLRMYGPGDVTGIDDGQVVRVAPEPHTDTFPPNYFPLVEFDRADLPWLFSPERAADDDGGKVRPWLCLVVVERDADDVAVETSGTRPLPALTAPATQLPPIEEVWAWAHAQVVGLLSDPELDRVFSGSTQQAISRLLCPRNLDANTPYVAAVVPTFEPGRRVGLGEEPFDDPENEPAVDPAWTTDADETVTLPVYHRWEFTTGDRGDFESLVEELEPRDLSEGYEVGVREVDMSDPGPIPLEAAEGLWRRLGGALQTPTVDPDPYPTVAANGDDAGKRLTLREILNDPATAVTDDGSDIPVVGPPIYGQWYVPPDAGPASATSLPQGAPEPAGVPTEGSAYFDSWFHDLNVDPRHRVPAGYGTEVIRENQEALMEEAWRRFGDLEAANDDVGTTQAGALVAGRLNATLAATGDAVVGFASRVRSVREVQRQIEVSGRLADEGVLDRDPITGVGGGPAIYGRERRFVEGIEGSDALLAGDGDGSAGGGVRLGTPRSDGGSPAAVDVAGAARFAAVTSPTFRRLTGSGGKLHAATGAEGPQPFLERARTRSESAGARALSGRFAATNLDPDVIADLPPVDPGTGEGGPLPAVGSTEWRVTEGGRVLELGEAIRHLGDERATLPKALVAVESVVDHAEMVRDRLSELRETIEAEPSTDRDEALAAAVAERPTLVDRAEAVRRNTFGALDRSLRRLVAADPEALSDDFTAEEREAVTRDAAEAQGRLVDAATEFRGRLRARDQHGDDEGDADRDREGGTDGGSDRRTDGGETDDDAELLAIVDDATAALDEVETAVTRVQGEIDPGIPPSAVEDESAPDAGGSPMRFTSGTPGGVGVVDEGDGPGAGQGDGLHIRDALVGLRGTEFGEFDTTDLVAGGGAGGIEPGGIDVGGGDIDGDVSDPDGFEEPPVVEEFDPAAQLETVRTDLIEGRAELPGLLDGDAWAARRAGWRLHPSIPERENPLDRIMAAPEFERPMYEDLRDVNQEYLLPGVDEIPRDTIGALVTNPEFIEAFMCGLNHEMGRELLWRRFPTDRRGTYFRQFWDYLEDAERKDIEKIHEWGTSALGEDSPGGDGGEKVVLIVRGDLLKAYPNTRIYAVKAVKEDKSDPDSDEADRDRVPLVEHRRQEALAERENDGYTVLPEYEAAQLEAWEPEDPIFRGKIDPDVTFFGFDIGVGEAVGDTIDETEDDDLGWFFVLEEPLGETRFGFDVPSAGDYGATPYGVRGSDRTLDRMPKSKYNDGAEAGWNALSWGHLVDDEASLAAKGHVRVAADRPGDGDGAAWTVTEGTRWTRSSAPHEEWSVDDEARWGHNSAHLAHITRQLPVRVCVHADDILPDLEGDGEDGDGSAGGDGAGATVAFPETWKSDAFVTDASGNGAAGGGGASEVDGGDSA
ncbi:hypothetical protein EKH57_15565 [Halorubrum sp. BOL3-1]|uniref:hypothetical protein n=1 Tax=Halorubrum sp. BOL3-1 TaxID=2497325 RepID=UPI001004F792|nr:hypothetical protein [Halorubrum sp. BOL3-1]QAU14009.1 hypothetical protein EKH57_15565 [Halorubrum sp. BOL3-1]